MQQCLNEKLIKALSPVYLEVVDESANHNVPHGAESHFKVVAVSSIFEGQRAVQRHQQVYRLLQEELAGSIHALALHLYTEKEWEEKGRAPESPQCLAGSKP